MATYVNDLRLTELATGEGSGTWGVTTNTNLELIGEALGYGTQDCFASDADATTTVADGATDPARAMYFKVTSSASLTATRTLTIAPNTMTRVMLIENATTGSQSIAISQGSGGNVTIASGQVKMVYLDGAGAGAAVVDALADLELGTITVANLTATTADINGGTIDGATIGGASAAAGTFTTLNATGGGALTGTWSDLGTVTTVDINGGTIDGATIGGASAGAGTFTNLTASGTVSFSGATVSDGGTVTTVNIDGGSIDGTIIGAASPAAGTFTTVTGTGFASTGDMTFGDNDKAVFGAGSDLQIFHDGNNSFISEAGTGVLAIQTNGANVTIQNSGGTANAVFNTAGSSDLYYNGSQKLATTATGIDVTGTVTADGLTVDVGADKNVLVGEISGEATIYTLNDAQTDNTDLRINAENLNVYTDGTKGLTVANNGDISFYEDTGTTPKFFWDASREALGIGTSTPDEALRVNGSSNGDSRLRLQNQGTDIGVFGSYLGWVGSGNANDLFVSSVGANNLILGSNSAERMRIDSSGNVGIGNSSPEAKLSILGGSLPTGNSGYSLSLSSALSATRLTTDASSNTSFIGSYYDNTSLEISQGVTAGYATGIVLGARSATNATVSDAIAFYTRSAEAARIDASGNLLVGGTTAESKVNIYTGGSTFSSGTMPAGMTIYSTTTDGQGSMLSFKAFSGAQGIAGIAGVRSSGWETELRFYTNNTAGQDSFSERARIDSSGRLLVGLTTNATAGPVQAVVTGTGTSFQTNPAVFGAVAGAAGREVPMIYGSDGTNSALISMLSGTMGFFTNGTEHARIDSSGNLLVGKTATTAAGALISGGQIQGTVTGAASATFQAWNQATSGDNLFVDFYTEGGSGTQRGSIDYNRTVGLVRYNTTSDYRAKDIIGPVQNTGATIDALKVYEGKMKGATQSRPMLIAHEAQEQAPYAVSGTKDAVNEDGTPDYQQIDHSSLVPLLIAEIQSLRARVAQLEGA